MQINRLFEIVYILLERQNVTAKSLAERFEVSSRTIYRDIETLSAANVPVYMRRGKSGGISLLPGYVLDRVLLSPEERGEILAALHGLSAADKTAGGALAKLSGLFGGGGSNINWVEVDYSDWNPQKRGQFDLIKRAIIERRGIRFDYYGTDGSLTCREAEPLTLWFKSRAWYLKAYCLTRQDFRLFRLSRIKNAELTDRRFEAKIMPDYDETVVPLLTPPEVKLKFSPLLRFKLFDEFDDEKIVQNPDGSSTVTFFAPVDEWLVGYIISLGPDVEALSPQSLRDGVRDRLQESLKIYL